jgi:hypothetical protein
MRAFPILLVAASLLIVAVPAANAKPNVPVWTCTSLRDSTCHSLFCFAISEQVPNCLPVTTTSGIPPSATCAEVIGPGPIAAACWVNGREVGPVATCEYCYPAFAVTCVEGTDGTLHCNSDLVQA